MKTKGFIAVAFLFAIIILLASCGGSKQEKSKELGTASLIEVKIEGMTCTGCEQTIQKNVGKLEGIKSVKATFTDGRAVIEYFPSVADTIKIREAITGSGYVVKNFTALKP
jgi:copper chaperone CopZ